MRNNYGSSAGSEGVQNLKDRGDIKCQAIKNMS
jgi:hypothetical protein